VAFTLECLPASTRQFNSGLILWRRSATSMALFEAWHHAVIRDDRTRFVTWKTAGRRVMPAIGERFGVPLQASHAR
jgi:hypothetical protein